MLIKEGGGRHTPFLRGYTPQFFFRATDVTGSVTWGGVTEMVMPGDNVKVVVELNSEVSVDDGLRFAVREGGKTAGGAS